MRVVAFVGSPHKNGNTVFLVQTLFDVLETQGIETEMVHISGQPLRGCIACGKCAKNPTGKCAQTDDPMNDWIAKMHEADGIVLACPTYFANVTTEMKALIDRAGMVSKHGGDTLRMKVGAPVVAARRAGAVQVYNSLMAFFGSGQMIVPGSCYWNMGFGLHPGDVAADAEGLTIMRTLGENMAHVLRKMHA